MSDIYANISLMKENWKGDMFWHFGIRWLEYYSLKLDLLSLANLQNLIQICGIIYLKAEEEGFCHFICIIRDFIVRLLSC